MGTQTHPFPRSQQKHRAGNGILLKTPQSHSTVRDGRMRATMDHMMVTSHPSHSSYAHMSLALVTGRARHVRLPMWSHEYLTASPHSTMYPPVTAMSRPGTERMLGPHPRPYHCGRAEEGFWRVQKSQGTNTWLVRSSTHWPPVCWSLMSPIQANTQTCGHWWPPTALKPCAPHPPLGAPEGTVTPNGLSPFLGVQAWWGGSEGQDSWTSSPSAPGRASCTVLNAVH